MKKLAILLILIVSAGVMKAQETNVSFQISNQKGEGVPFATVMLTAASDSSNQFRKVTDSTGKAVFNNVAMGNYRVTVSSVSYETLQKGISIVSAEPVFTITLEALSGTL